MWRIAQSIIRHCKDFSLMTEKHSYEILDSIVWIEFGHLNYFYWIAYPSHLSPSMLSYSFSFDSFFIIIFITHSNTCSCAYVVLYEFWIHRPHNMYVFFFNFLKIRLFVRKNGCIFRMLVCAQISRAKQMYIIFLPSPARVYFHISDLCWTMVMCWLAVRVYMIVCRFS